MAELKELEGPYELLDLEDRGILETGISGWEVGSITIHPGRTERAKTVKTLRIHVTPKWKTFFPYYWDLTSQTLVAQLLPWLQRADYKRYKYTIQKFGYAPRARFTLSVIRQSEAAA